MADCPLGMSHPSKSPGEVGVIMVLAADRDQAGVLLNLIGSNPMLAQLATGECASGSSWALSGSRSRSTRRATGPSAVAR